MQTVEQRFLEYVGYDTQSAEDSASFPSTEKQKCLGEHLVSELCSFGATDAKMDAYGYVTATIPSNRSNASLPVLGLLAHMDTSPDLSGANVKSRIVTNYQGGDIVLHAEKGIVMQEKEFEHLQECIGCDLIVTDGTTLLGADDKAGIAEIMTMAQTLFAHPELPHGTVKIAFTPDEEVGRGTDFFDVKAFGADFAYTVDGGKLGEIEYENFNAASAKITINGVNIHPGSAKNKMKNAITIATELHQMLPHAQCPEHTADYEGFYHLCHMAGTVELTTLTYLIRDHSTALFIHKKEELQAICALLNARYGAGTVELHLQDSYYNMKEQILPHYHLVETALMAMEALDIVPCIKPVRGGTDGARLSFAGLPCPNIGTGGYNYHGRYECIPVQSMQKTVELLLKIVEIYGK